MKYDIFISYKHSDLDDAVAAYLQKALDHYKIPKDIQKKSGKKKITRVFRDIEELSVSSSLESEIKHQLSKSEYLVVICSPESKNSPWVQREIELFLCYQTFDHILPVLIKGTPEDSFPEILYGNGEPLAADFRGNNKKQVLKNARKELKRIIAPVLHCSYDELVQRTKVYHMKRSVAVAAFFAVLGIIFSATVLLQNLKITQNYRDKLENQSRYLAKLSGELLKSGNREEAMLVALEALPKGEDDGSRPFVAEARMALEDALYLYPHEAEYTFYAWKKLEHKALMQNTVDWNEHDQILITSDQNGTVYIWNMENGSLQNTITDKVCQKLFITNNHQFVISTETGFYCYDYLNKKEIWNIDFSSNNMLTKLKWDYCKKTDTIIGMDNEFCSVSNNSTEYNLFQIDAATGKFNYSYLTDICETANDSSIYCRDISISPDGNLAVIVKYGYSFGADSYTWYLYDLNTQKCLLKNTLNDIQWHYNKWIENNQMLIITSEKSYDSVGFYDAHEWNAILYDMQDGSKIWNYSDVSISMLNNTTVDVFDTSSDDYGEVSALSITYGNTNVILNKENADILSRVEDHHSLIFSRPLSSHKAQIIITDDGNLFLSKINKACVTHRIYSAYDYNLGIDQIDQIYSYSDNLFILQGSTLYWYKNVYSGQIPFGTESDEEFTNAVFSNSGRYLCTSGYDTSLCLYDTSNGNQIYKDTDVATDGTASFIKDDTFLIYLNKDMNLKLYNLLDDTTEEIVLPSNRNEKKTNYSIGINNIRSNHAVVFNQHYSIYKNETIAWNVDLNDFSVSSFTLEWFESELNAEDNIIHLTSAASAGQGRYLIFLGTKEKSSLDENETFLLIWDCQENNAVEIADLHSSWLDNETNLYSQDGWISHNGDLIALYGTDKKIRILSLHSGNVITEIQTDGIKSDELTFSPDDQFLIYQNIGFHLCVFDLNSGTMIQNDSRITEATMRFNFSQDGKIMYASLDYGGWTSNSIQLYTRQTNGEYTLNTLLDFCDAAYDGKFVGHSGSTHYLYPIYSLNELISKARNILQGKELTIYQRKEYMIDNY